MKKICFNAGGRLTILQVTDLHTFAAPEPEDELSLRRAIEASSPDVIILTGDNISGYACGNRDSAGQAVKNNMDILESYGIPVAAVFGNHDDDRTPYTKYDQLEQYGSYSCFIGCEGVTAERNIGGKHTVSAGTYNIPVFESEKHDRPVYNLWCFDSGSDHPDPAVDSYGYVFPEQVEWYVKTEDALTENNGGVRVPSLVFQHISPPHIVRVLKEVPEGTAGAVRFAGSWYVLPDGVDPQKNWMREAPCPPDTDLDYAYAQVDAMLDHGDVKAVFFGHDHINAFTLDYRGIGLVCSPGCGYHSYNDEHKGFRVITLDKNDLSSYETRLLFTKDLLSSRY